MVRRIDIAVVPLFRDAGGKRAKTPMPAGVQVDSMGRGGLDRHMSDGLRRHLSTVLNDATGTARVRSFISSDIFHYSYLPYLAFDRTWGAVDWMKI